MSALTERLRASDVYAVASVQPSPDRPESAYSFAAALWQESATARISRKGTAAHMAIGPLVAKLHLGVIDCGIAESVFVNLLSQESE